MALKKRLPLRALILILAGLLSGCSSVSRGSQSASSAAGPALWLISIDGFRPEFYQGGAFQAPFLASLTRKGAWASEMEPIYPSVTYPNHASLVTGTSSARHGVLSNRYFDPVKGPTLDWYWNASAIRVPTLWDAVRKAGGKSAVVNWPVTLGAGADWVIPEIFPKATFKMSVMWDETVRATAPETLKEVLAESEVAGFVDIEQHDSWVANAARVLHRNHHPRLLLLHLTQLDLAQHFNGLNSPKVATALRNVDDLLSKLLEGFDYDRDCVFIAGDHGFQDVSQVFRVNTLWVREGWIRAPKEGPPPSRFLPEEWQVIAHPSGAQAAVYSRDEATTKRALASLRPWAKGRFKILSRSDLDALHALPAAAFALEPENGWTISGELRGPLIEKLAAPHGEHGQLPSLAHSQAGFLAVGACAQPGRQLGRIRLIDVAPSAAEFLHAPLPDAEGKPLKLKNGS